jgi:hypothetical protein
VAAQAEGGYNMMTRTIIRTTVLALMVACGGDSSAPDGTDGGGNQPPAGSGGSGVVVVDGAVAHSSGGQTVTLHLRNDGSAGSYRLQFWGKPTTTGGPDTSLGDTDPVDVTADYDATVSYRLDPEPTATFVVVFTRDASNNKFLETDRFTFP